MSQLDEIGDCGARVVDFDLSEDNRLITLSEACDKHFSTELNKQEFGELIAELTELHNKMID